MKHLTTIIFVLATLMNLQAQERHVVFFTDKNNSPYSLASPLDFLSQRAIDRRSNQGIAIDQTDLPVNPQYLQGVTSAGGSVLNTTKWFNAAIVEVSNPSVLGAINSLPFVASMQRVALTNAPAEKPIHKFSRETSPASDLDPTGSLQRNSNFMLSYGYGSGQVSQIGLPPLHDNGYRGQGKLIAVLDAGFQDAPLYACFNQLFSQNRIIATRDFVDNEQDVYDDNSHGMSVLSCIASNFPDSLIGTAPEASFLLLRSEDAGSEYIIEEYNWAVAAEYADSAGADIINSSLGYTLFDDSTQNHSYSTMDGNTNPVTVAADFAASKGIIVVNSAGNEGGSNWNYISAPADADSILSIGAVDASGAYAFFSGNGPTFDGRIKPDVAATGQGTWLYSPWGGGNPGQGNGTSFSSPIIAGAVACLWQAQPGKTAQEIIHAVRQSASLYTSPDTLLGYGIPDFSLANTLLSAEEVNSITGLELQAFPNPAAHGLPVTVFVKVPGNENGTLTLHDLSGRRLETRRVAETGKYLLETTGTLPAGCYYLTLNFGTRSESVKLVRF